MKKVWSFILVLFCAGLLSAQRLPETASPVHYQIKLAPDLTKATFTGDETIEVNIVKPATSIVLNAAEIDFKEATVTAGNATQKAAVTKDAKSETATFVVENSLPVGPASIHIAYTGILNDQLRGFYLSKGKNRNYATTQMEPTDARRAFPSFDEPTYKATFVISVIADKDDIAISNGMVVSDVPGPGENQHTITFSRTAKMSSYLVALAVGDFKCVEGGSDGIPIRVCATPDKVELLHFALESAEHIMHFYNNQYYSIKYPYKKLDILAVPDFSAGAMENTGAIFYREALLLVDDKTVTPENRKYVAEVVGHEMAHMWFGDLVTMKWWNDLWLNEGFADWVMRKPVHDWHPEWNNTMNETEDGSVAMATDSLVSTHPIRVKVENPGEISELFDLAISYYKTAAVLRMLENYTGPEDFRKGVNQYLQAHAYANANAEDFWNSMTKASGKPVDKVLSSFVEQQGVPLVSVSAKCQAGHTTVQLKQQRFFYDPTALNAGSPEQWQIPVCIKTPNGKQCTLLTQKQQTLAIEGCPAWFFANNNVDGYYRTSYDAASLQALEQGVEKNLNARERLQLVADQWALVRADRNKVSDFLRLVGNMKDERERAVWGELVAHINYVYDRLVDDADRPAYEAWVRNLLQPAAQDLGWQPVPGESGDRATLRSYILGALAYSGHDAAVIEKSKALVQQAMKDPASFDSNVRAVIVTTAANNGDAALYDQYLAHMRNTKEPQEYFLYAGSLANFPQPELVKRSLERILTDEVRSQDTTGALGALLGTPTSQQQAWEFTKAHWPDLEKKLASYTRGDVINSTSGFCDASLRDDVQSFFSSKNIPSADRTLRLAVERMNSCISMRANQQGDLAAYLHQAPAASGQ